MAASVMRTPLWSRVLGVLIGFLLGAGATYAAIQYSYEAEVPASVVIATCTPGDANENGEINMGDVTKVERIILEVDAETPGADASEDGVVDMADVVKIERIILGID